MRSSGNEVDNMKVSLEMDNRSFEEGAKKSLSTLDRLKQALAFKGVKSTVLDGLGKAADIGKAGVGSLTNSVSSLGSALGAIKDVAGFTMITNAANSAYQAVENLVKSVTVEQVGAGFEKYANITESMQTIMSATSDAYSSQEAQLEAVTKQMDKLNWFADETAFSLEDMSSSIGKFTANKVDLETAVTAIQGIGTWASKSGASVSDAGRAMYNLSQAIAVGSVKLIDWKSIENANMATSQFKQTVIETAESVGTLTKVEEGLWKTSEGNEVSVTNFNEALKDEWFTSKVLLDSLDKYGNFSVKLNDYSDEFKGDFGAANVMNLIDAFKAGEMGQKEWEKAVDESGVEMERLKEIITDLSQEQYEFGMSAFRAAQETKTWEEAVDYTKEAVSTGWMNTFEILFGQYTEAKKLWSDVSEFFYDIFVTGGENRNDLLEEAFSQTEAITKSDWEALKDKGVLNPVFLDALKNVGTESGIAAEDLENLDDAVRNGLITSGMLEEAYDKMMAPAGTVANETAEQIKAISEEDEAIKAFLETLEGYDDDAIDKITFGDHKYTEGYEDLEKGLDNVIKSLGLTQDEGAQVVEAFKAMGYFGGTAEEALEGYTDEQLRALGMTDAQIEEFKKLRDEGGDLSAMFEELGIDNMTAGEHWTQALHNVMDIIREFKDLIQDVWGEFFPSLEASSISNFLKAFDEGSASLLEYVTAAGEADDGSNKLRNALTAIASVVDVVVSHVKMIGQALAFKGLLIGFEKLSGFLSLFKKLSGALLGGAAVFNFVKGFIEGLGIDFGDLANKVSLLITKFNAWFKAANPIGKAMGFISNKGKQLGQSVRAWVDALIDMPIVQNGIKKLEGGFKIFTEGFSGHMDEGKKKFDEFMAEVDKMGGFSFQNIGKIAELGSGMFLDWIKTFPGVQTMLDALSDIWSGLREKLIEMGVPVEKIEAAFGGLGSALSWSFHAIVDGFQWVLDKANEFEQWFLNLPVVQSAITRFGGAFKTIGQSFLPFVQGLPDAWQKFIDKVNNLGGFKIKNIGNIFKAFKEEFLGYITNWDGFKAIKDAFKGFFGDIGNMLSGNETLVNAFKGIKEFFLSLKEAFGGIELPKSFDDIPRFLSDVKEAILGMSSEGTGGGLAGKIFDGAKFVLLKVIDLVNFVISHWKLFLGISLVLFAFKKISGLFNDIHEYFLAKTKELKARAFLERAAGFVLIAASVWIIAQTFKDLIQTFGKNDFVSNIAHIIPGIIAIVAVIAAMVILFKTVGKMDVKPGTAWGVAAAVAALWLVAHAFIDFSEHLSTGDGFIADMAKIIPAIIAMAAIVGAMAALFFVVGKMNVQSGTTWGVAAAVAALWVVAQAFKDLSKLSWDEIKRGILALGVVMGGLAAVLFVVGKMDVQTGTVVALAVVIGALAGVLIALSVVSAVNPKGMDRAMKALLVIMVGLAAILAIAGILKPSMGVMIGLAVVIGLTAGVIVLLDKIVGIENTIKIAEGLAKLFGALGLLLLAVSVIGKMQVSGIVKGVVGMVAVIAALVAVVAAIGWVVEEFELNSYIESGVSTVSRVLDSVLGALSDILVKVKESLFGDKTPLQALTDDVAYFVQTIASPEFAANIAKIGELKLLGMAGVNGALITIFTSVIGKEAGVMALFNAVSMWATDRTAIQQLADDINYFVSTIANQTFIDNINRIGEMKLLGMSGVNGALVAIFTAIFGAEGAIMKIFNTIMQCITGSDETAIQGLANDIKTLADTIGGEEFANDMKRLGELKLLGSAGINGALVAIFTAIFGAEGVILKIFNTILEFAAGDKDFNAIRYVVNDVKYLADTLGSEEFEENIKRIGSMNYLEGAITAAVWEGVASIFGTGGALLKIADSIIQYATGDKDFNAVRYAVNDVKYLADTLGSEEFSANITRLGELDSFDAVLNATAVGGLTALFGAGGAIGSIVDSIIEFATGDKDYNAVRIAINNVKYLADQLGSEEFSESMTNLGAVTVPTTQISDLVSALGEIELSELVTAVQELIKGWLTGDDQSAVESWAGDVKTLAGAIKTWNAEMEAAGDLYVDTEGINSLTTAVDSVGKTGGLFGAISTFVTGAKDLGQFKTDAEELGKGIKAFIDGLGDSTNMSKIRSARDITRDIASISASASQLMDGTFWVDNMGEQLIHVATNINTFADHIKDPETLSAIGPAVGNITSAIFSFSQMKFDGDIMDESLVKKFQDDIQKIIDTITKTADVDVSGISRIKGAVEEANSIELEEKKLTYTNKDINSSKMAKENGAAVGESTVEGIKESSGAATEAASGLLSSMVTALSNMSGFIEAGASMANAVAAGLRTGFDAVRSEAAALGSTASSSIMAAGVLSDLWAAGHNFVQGFADGIALYTYISNQAATRMANSAKESANKALDSHSPSREMMKVGGYFGEGFEIGIVNSIAGVASAAEHMGEMAMSGLRATVSGINEILSANIDSEPVIRPVLDMSEIQNGASNLSSMFTAMNIVDPFGSFDVIGNAVDARRAATSLDDVVMALGSVEKSTSNIRGGDTFNVNGITYDDGSNIADAIRILTHAVVSERRR